MSMRKGFFGLLSLAMLTIGIQLPTSAQSLAEMEPVVERAVYEAPLGEAASTETAVEGLNTQNWVPSEASLTAETLMTEPVTADAELVYPVSEEEQIAQVRRRRTQSAVPSPDFIGIGGDLGTAGDITFAVISKLSVRPQIAVRPSVLIGDDFAVLVPVTYQFNRFNTNAAGFQISPYAGVGASYVDGDDSSDIGLLLSGGVDVPVSQRFTVNAQANYAGVFSDSENFGVTVGVGYNFGGLLR